MTAAKTIKYLRKQIPAFKCKEGCYECCGPVPFSKWEWKQVKDKRVVTELTCPYAGKKGCEIYEDRPIVCRLFGVTSRMRCPHGCQPARLISKKKEREIMDKYYTIMDIEF